MLEANVDLWRLGYGIRKSGAFSTSTVHLRSTREMELQNVDAGT
jgi:hypothetical protein